MKKKSQPASAVPTQVSLSLPSSLTLNFDAQSPLKVSMTSDKPEQKLNLYLLLLVILFLTGAAIWLPGYWYFVVERGYSPQPIALPNTSLSARMAYPARVAFGEEAELDLILTNQGTDIFTGNLVVSLENAHLLPNETGTLKVENLGSKESRTFRLKFSLLPKPGTFSGGVVRTTLQASSNTRLLSSTAGDEIPIARLQYARSLILWLRNSAITLAVAALLWEVARKLLFKWEAK